MGSAISGGGERPAGAVIVLRDVSREQQYLDQLSWHASHDGLTGLENRVEFERRLQRLLNQGQHRLRPAALLYMDLDQFKLINETCGHPAGDEMLCEVSRLLLHNLRETDTWPAWAATNSAFFWRTVRPSPRCALPKSCARLPKPCTCTGASRCCAQD